MSLVIKRSDWESTILPAPKAPRLAHSTQGPCPVPAGARRPLPLVRVSRAAVFRGLFAFSHAVVTHHGRDAQAVIGKDTRAPANLRGAVAAEVAPAPHRLLVAPERERQDLVLVREAREALDRYEPVDPLELRPQLRREVDILLSLAGSRDDFEYDDNHGVLAMP